MCEYCEGQRKFYAEAIGKGIVPMPFMVDRLFGGFEDDGVAYIKDGMLWVDNSSGEYAEFGFKINYCPNCGARMEEEE